MMACPIYVSSGKQEIYRPTYRSEAIRKIVNKYIKKGGKTLAKFTGDDIETQLEDGSEVG